MAHGDVRPGAVRVSLFSIGSGVDEGTHILPRMKHSLMIVGVLLVSAIAWTLIGSPPPAAVAGPQDAAATVPGLAVHTVVNGNTFDETYAAVEGFVRDPATPPGVVLEVDHAANAASAGLDLEPTRVLVFGAPAVGTPLMLDEQSSGIDLPQKILVWQDGADVHVAYNTPAYLAARHGLDAVDGQLATIGGVLSTIAERATGDDDPSIGAVTATPGLVEIESRRAVAGTQRQLERVIRKGPLTKVLTVDHSANARTVGLELAPTIVTVFGNPAVGTPLMQDQRTIAIDLPQTMLVSGDDKDDQDTFVTYEDPFGLADRHAIAGQDARLAAIRDALSEIAATAADR